MSENVPRIEMLFVWTVVSLNGTVLNERDSEQNLKCSVEGSACGERDEIFASRMGKRVQGMSHLKFSPLQT